MYLFCIICKYIVATIKVPTLVLFRKWGSESALSSCGVCLT